MGRPGTDASTSRPAGPWGPSGHKFGCRRTGRLTAEHQAPVPRPDGGGSQERSPRSARSSSPPPRSTPPGPYPTVPYAFACLACQWRGPTPTHLGAGRQVAGNEDGCRALSPHPVLGKAAVVAVLNGTALLLRLEGGLLSSAHQWLGTTRTEYSGPGVLPALTWHSRIARLSSSVRWFGSDCSISLASSRRFCCSSWRARRRFRCPGELTRGLRAERDPMRVRIAWGWWPCSWIVHSPVQSGGSELVLAAGATGANAHPTGPAGQRGRAAADAACFLPDTNTKSDCIHCLAAVCEMRIGGLPWAADGAARCIALRAGSSS